MKLLPGRNNMENISTSGKLQILLQSSKLSKHRVVAVIAGVGASLADEPHTRHWCHLADCKMYEIVKIRNTDWVLQTCKSEGSAYDCCGGASLRNLAHARTAYQKTSIKLQVVQIFFNPQTRKFKIGQSLVLSTSGFKHWKPKKTHPPPTLNTELAEDDGEIAPWSQQFEKHISTSEN